MQEGLREYGSHQNFSVRLTQSVTLKIDTVHLSELLEQTQTTWCENAKSYHHWNNHQEGLKP
jgi:hypothetical protein